MPSHDKPCPHEEGSQSISEIRLITTNPSITKREVEQFPGDAEDAGVEENC